MKKQDQQYYNDPWDRDFYETGSTRPPKNHGGIIAVLLIMVIVLGGMTTFLGLMNIRMFQMLSNTQSAKNEEILQTNRVDVPRDPSQSVDATVQPERQEYTAVLGMECITVSNFDRRYYDIPQGCLVMAVEDDSSSQEAGICVGDVIISLNGHGVDSIEELTALLEKFDTDKGVSLVVYRSQTKQRITIDLP